MSSSLAPRPFPAKENIIYYSLLTRNSSFINKLKYTFILRKIVLCSFLLFFFKTSAAGAKVLPFLEVIQEQSQWCWAAVSRGLLHYYGHDLKQCTIAEYTRKVALWHDFGQVECCQDPSKGCNYWNYYAGGPGSIVDILKALGSVASKGLGAALTPAQIAASLDQDERPFVVRWGYTSGGGHFVVGHGLTGATLSYMNPWFGEGAKVALLSWVEQGANHTWTHSVLLTESCRCTKKSTCCDGCKPLPGTLACSDGDACTQGDGCLNGTCWGGPRLTCPLLGSCLLSSSCEASSGTCGQVFKVNGTPCDDEDPCTETDRCHQGACLGLPRSCPASGECQGPGVCARPSGTCSYTPLTDGTPCTGGRCQAGVCVPELRADGGRDHRLQDGTSGEAKPREVVSRGCQLVGGPIPAPGPVLFGTAMLGVVLAIMRWTARSKAARGMNR